MLWKELCIEFEKTLVGLKSKTINEYRSGFAELQNYFKKHHPEYLAQPLLISNISNDKLKRLYNPAGKEKNDKAMKHKCYNAFKKIHKLILKYHYQTNLNPEMDASMASFSKANVVYCVEQFLIANGWEIKTKDTGKKIEADIIAVKAGVEFVGLAIGSAKKIKGILLNKEYVDKESFLGRLGRMMVSAFQMGSGSKKREVALLFPDEDNSRRLMNGFKKQFKKCDLKIYMVASLSNIKCI